MYIMVLKVKSIIIMLLFLFAIYTPANATIYLNIDAEDGTVGNTVPNPPLLVRLNVLVQETKLPINQVEAPHKAPSIFNGKLLIISLMPTRRYIRTQAFR